MTQPATMLDAVAQRILGMAFILGVALPLASLPPFQFGYWAAAEPLVVGLHLCAALAALGLALAALRPDGLAQAAFRTPMALLPLALGAYSLLTAPLVATPALSILGAPQSGQGALWYVEFGLLIAAARYLRATGTWKTVRRLAIAAVLAVAVLKGFDWWWERQGGKHLLIWVAAYYAWLGLALPVLTHDSGRVERWLGWGAAVAVLLAGRSTTAAGAAVLALAVLGMSRLAGNRPGMGKALAGLPLLPLMAAPVLLLTLPIIRSVLSLADRRSLLLMTGEAFASWQPSTWLTGLGWGRTQDVFHTHLASSGQVLWDGSWIFMTSDYFHSHSALAEALLGAGIPGLLLTAAWFPGIVLGAEPGKRALAAAFATALAAFAAMWFQLSLSLPLTALALATLAPPLAASRQGAPWRLGAVAGLAASLAFLAVGLRLYDHGLGINAVQADLQALAPAPRPFPVDPRGHDLAAAELINDAMEGMTALSETDRARALPAAKAMAAHLSQKIPGTSTMLLPVTGLSWHVHVRGTGKLAWLAEHVPEADVRYWATWLDRALTMAPGRTDLAIPYLTQLAMAGHNGEVRQHSDRILTMDPRDPVGLYFRGLLLVQDPRPEAKRLGLETLRTSAASGIERFMPLDPSLRPLLHP